MADGEERRETKDAVRPKPGKKRKPTEAPSDVPPEKEKIGILVFDNTYVHECSVYKCVCVCLLLELQSHIKLAFNDGIKCGRSRLLHRKNEGSSQLLHN